VIYLTSFRVLSYKRAEKHCVQAIPPLLTNYLLWLGIAGALLVLSFLGNRGNVLRSIAGLFAAVGVLIYLFIRH
jgi:hypothetical protein